MQKEIIQYLRRRDTKSLKELLTTPITEDEFLALVGPIKLFNAGDFNDLDVNMEQAVMVIYKEWSTCIGTLELRYIKMTFEIAMGMPNKDEGLKNYHYDIYRKSSRMCAIKNSTPNTLDEWFDSLHKYYLVVKDHPQYLAQRQRYIFFYTPEEFTQQLEDIIGIKVPEMGYFTRLKIVHKLDRLNLDEITYNKIYSIIQNKNKNNDLTLLFRRCIL